MPQLQVVLDEVMALPLPGGSSIVVDDCSHTLVSLAHMLYTRKDP